MQVEVGKNLTAETLPGTLAGTDILVVRSTKVTAASIEAAAQLSLIIRAGAGVDTIDLAAASAGESTWPTVRARTRRPSPSWPSAC